MARSRDALWHRPYLAVMRRRGVGCAEYPRGDVLGISLVALLHFFTIKSLLKDVME